MSLGIWEIFVNNLGIVFMYVVVIRYGIVVFLDRINIGVIEIVLLGKVIFVLYFFILILLLFLV